MITNRGVEGRYVAPTRQRGKIFNSNGLRSKSNEAIKKICLSSK